MHSDMWGSIVQACKACKINLSLSQPGMHETNAVIENINLDNLNGTTSKLREAGHLACMWLWAAACYCFNKNLELQDDDAESPYAKRHGKQFTGTKLPYGCAVWFKPAPTNGKLPQKAQPNGVRGVFLGYRLAPGGIWNGEYVVEDLFEFLERDHSIDARSQDWLMR